MANVLKGMKMEKRDLRYYIVRVSKVELINCGQKEGCLTMNTDGKMESKMAFKLTGVRVA